LGELASRWSRLRTITVEDAMPIESGVLYICPASYHTLVERDHKLALSTDARVSFARPSIDVLFESVARSYRSRAIGVLLSGFGTDGVAGLDAIRRAGGRVLCQDPSTASAPHLPQSALDAGTLDFTGSPSELGSKLEELCP
jgi:two-component system chemotaxis response regulator CheB